MLKPNITKAVYCLLFVAVLYVIACNTSTDTSTQAQAPKDTLVAKVSTIEQDETFAGSLDTLYESMAVFDTLKGRKLVMSFVFKSRNKVTLHGWAFQKCPTCPREFPDQPDLILSRLKKSSLNYNGSTYFGGLVVDSLQKVKNRLNAAGAKFVLFAPTFQGNHLTYQIFYSVDEALAPDKIFTAAPLGTTLNPSPPKNR